jgi:integrase
MARIRVAQRTKLTVKSVEAQRPGGARREIPDAYLTGLYLIVQPTGAKSWAVRYYHGGRSHKYTLGPYPLFGLKAAREAGGKALRAVAEGHDPATAKKQTAGSIESVVAQFLERHAKRHYRPRPLKEAERLLRLYVLGKWRGRKASEISRADVRAMLDGIAAPIAANRVHSITRKLFNWAVENDWIAVSPVLGIRAPHPETSRDRVLSDIELCSVWRAADKIGYPLGSIIQLLILTGQRRGEVGGMMWSELDGELWTLPRERVKNDRRHEVPLSRQALAIIGQLPRIGERYVFTSNGSEPFNGFYAKERLDQLAGTADAWTMHDLRRTAASGMAKLGVSLVVIEKVLNHVSGSLAGIVGVYQRQEFAEEKRAALQKWADHVERLVR